MTQLLCLLRRCEIDSLGLINLRRQKIERQRKIIVYHISRLGFLGSNLCGAVKKDSKTYRARDDVEWGEQ